MIVDGQPQPQSLFQMIQRSTEASPGGVLSAYRDNAAVIEGHAGGRFFPTRRPASTARSREPIAHR